ncbi:MAG: alpha/beta hydrolase [Planctomycetes bacterium]|nr:alpha/beta hydrolase [Planctomycetota bacterium]
MSADRPTPGTPDPRPPTSSGNKGFFDGGRFFWACEYAGVKQRGPRAAGEVSLWVEIEGEGDPLLLVHGGPDLDHRYFHPGMSILAARRRLIYVDLRGRFMSRTKQPLGFDQDVRDLAAVMTTLGLESADVFAHSHGGFLAAAFAKAYPGRVKKLILCATPWGETQEEVDLRVLQSPAAARAGTLEERRRVRESLYFFGLPDKESKRYYDKVIEWHESAVADEFRRTYQPPAAVPGIEDLKGLKCPLMFLAGRDDPHTSTVKLYEASRELDPQAKVAVIERCRHMPWVERPEHFKKAVEGFLSGT